MELSSLNLYTQIIELGDKERILTREKLPTVEQGKTDKLKEGENLSLFAYRHYSKFTENADKLWYVIADANNIHNPLSVPRGTLLFIPDFYKVLLNI